MDKLSKRKALVQSRLDMPDRLARADLLQRVMRIWLVGSPHEVIGAYWPIKGEFDPLPALYRWQEDAMLADLSESNEAPGQEIPAQLATESIAGRSPRKIGLPVVNKQHKTLTFHAWYPGYRLGYGGGFYDRTLATLQPRPFTVGLGYTQGWLPDLTPEAHDIPLDVILNDNGVVWPV